MSNGKKNAEENIFEEKAGGNRRKIVYQWNIWDALKLIAPQMFITEMTDANKMSKIHWIWKL